MDGSNATAISGCSSPSKFEMPTLPTPKPTNVPERILHSIEETATLLSLSRMTVIRMTYRGKLETRKIGRRRLITRASIDKLVRQSVG